MDNFAFTAQELLTMAFLDGRQYTYGLPDVFSELSANEKQIEVQKVCDMLVERKIASLDFDGKTTLAKEYKELMDYCTSCDKCLTVNLYRANGSADDYILWQLNGTYLMAEADVDLYRFHKVDHEEIGNLLAAVSVKIIQPKNSEAIVPYSVLEKIKRLVENGQMDEAIRALRQNGVEERIAYVIVDGLQQNADYIGLLLMDNYSDHPDMTELVLLNSRGVVLEISSSMVNLRNCAKFSESNTENVDHSIESLTKQFLSGT